MLRIVPEKSQLSKSQNVIIIFVHEIFATHPTIVHAKTSVGVGIDNTILPLTACQSFNPIYLAGLDDVTRVARASCDERRR